MMSIVRVWLMVMTLVIMSGCLYKMPKEEDFDLRPTTNNPHVIKEQDQNWVPGVAY